MANIEKLDYGEFLRPSTAHAIGKINEIIDNLDSGGGGGTEFATVIINSESTDYPIADKTYAELVEIASTGKPVLAFVDDDVNAQWYKCFTDVAIHPDREEQYNVVVLERVWTTLSAIQAQEFYFTENEFLSWSHKYTYDIAALKDVLPTVTVSYDTESDPIVATVDNFPDPQLYPKYQAVLIKDTYINDVTLGNVIWDESDPSGEPVQIVWGFSGIVNGSIAYNTMTLTLEAYILNEGELVIETDTVSGGGSGETVVVECEGAESIGSLTNATNINISAEELLQAVTDNKNIIISYSYTDTDNHLNKINIPIVSIIDYTSTAASIRGYGRSLYSASVRRGIETYALANMLINNIDSTPTLSIRVGCFNVYPTSVFSITSTDAESGTYPLSNFSESTPQSVNVTHDGSSTISTTSTIINNLKNVGADKNIRVNFCGREQQFLKVKTRPTDTSSDFDIEFVGTYYGPSISGRTPQFWIEIFTLHYDSTNNAWTLYYSTTN